MFYLFNITDKSNSNKLLNRNSIILKVFIQI